MSSLKIAIIVGSTRPGRNGKVVADWVLGKSASRTGADYELIDLVDFPLPHMDEGIPPSVGQYAGEHTKAWAAKIGAYDGFIFVTPEYNHSTSGVLKNAIDYLHSEIRRKPATFLGYGGTGAARAIGHLGEMLLAASLKHTVHIGMIEMIGMLREGKSMADYPYLDDYAKRMLDEIVWWANTLKEGRSGDEFAEAA